MSRYTIIQETTLELRRLIIAALTSAPDAVLDITENEITFSLPTHDLTDTPRLSIYLYHIEIDGNLRNQNALSVGQNGQRFPPLPLALHYLITPLDNDQPVNHLMLGRILQFFHDHSHLATLNGVRLDDSFGGNSREFRIVLDTLSVDRLSQIWGALNDDYHLAVAYQVRVVAIDSDAGVAEAHRVVTTHPVVGLMARNAPN